MSRAGAGVYGAASVQRVHLSVSAAALPDCPRQPAVRAALL
jgi:hypothetical protein